MPFKMNMLLSWVYVTALITTLSGHSLKRTRREHKSPCSGVNTDLYLAAAGRPVQCNEYIHCAHGKEIKGTCKSGQHWSIGKNACAYPEEADCIPDLEELARICYERSLKRDSTSNVNGELTNYPFDCMHYLNCAPNGIAYRMACPKDLYWNNVLKICDYNCTRGLDEFF